MRQVHSSYLQSVFNIDDFPVLVKATVKVAKKLKSVLDFDGLAFCGVSGAAMAFPLSVALKLPLLCVRKPENNSHHYGQVEGDMAIERYLIIDDFISMGRTCENIVNQVRRYSADAKPVGILLYMTANDWPNGKVLYPDEYGPSITLPVYKSLPASLSHASSF